MTFDELLASYDERDREFKKRFIRKDKSKVRPVNSHYFAFIPTKEECEKILLDPLRRLRDEIR